MRTRFHEYLTKIRKSKRVTQSQMAETLGISRSTYTNYETGRRAPNLETLEQISEALDCSMDELFGKISQQKNSVICEMKTPYMVVSQESEKNTNKKLAIGVQDYRRLRDSDGYYVDKTQMILEFLESEYQITLITRPRRFGKTLNMSMLAEFLDHTKDSADVFAGTKISKTFAVQEMNEHPVVFLSFLNVKGDTADDMIFQLMVALEYEYRRHMPVIRDSQLPMEQIEKLQNIYNFLNTLEVNDAVKRCLPNVISILCQALMAHYGKRVYLLIDEYDTPFIAANAGGYYDEIRDILTGILSTSLKGNAALNKALLTGIQRVAKENIFSGLNNMAVCTVNDPEYSDCFGFTKEETRQLLKNYCLELTEAVSDMYDGYIFGQTKVYNPWSVTLYAARRRLDSYWVNTSENSIIQNALDQSSELFVSDYKRLIEHGTADVPLEMETAYYEQPDDASLWGLLVNAGMITVAEHIENNYYTVKIPNYEVREAFQNLTAFYLKIQEGHIAKLLMCLKLEKMEEFADIYRTILMELPSYHDLRDENSYHMMMLGMCAFLYRDYEVKSNREYGKGRSDISLCAKRKGCPHMILEFKYTKDISSNLEELAKEAVSQIKEKKYNTGMNGKVYYIGLAHCGKNAEVKWKSEVKE